MTREQWKELTAEEQRVKVAELCGFYSIGNEDWVGMRGHRSEYHPIPNYLNDLNAMHEAEEKLSDRQRKESYGWALAGIVHCGDDEEEDYDGIDTCVLKDDIDFLFHATAAQRAEAFVLTMEK